MTLTTRLPPPLPFPRPCFQVVYQVGIAGHTAGQYQTGGEWGKTNGATVVFRIVIPMALIILAALFTRFWCVSMWRGG